MSREGIVILEATEFLSKYEHYLLQLENKFNNPGAEIKAPIDESPMATYKYVSREIHQLIDKSSIELAAIIGNQDPISI